MASKVPVVTQVAWISLVPHLALIAALALVAYLLGVHPIAGVIAYLVISISLRRFVAKFHVMGSKLTRSGKFARVIPYYEQSYKFFTRNQWIDDWRYITLLSASQICYREMALVSAAFCYGQMGEGKKSYEVYRQVLLEFPESTLALSAIRLMDSARSATQ